MDASCIDVLRGVAVGPPSDHPGHPLTRAADEMVEEASRAGERLVRS